MSVVDALYQLYLADQQVRGLESRLHGAAGRVRTTQMKLEQAEQAVKELRDQLAHVKASEANLEMEANAAEARVTKLREQMNSAKNNKEYSALLVEVNTLKADKGKLEDQALELMTKIEQLTQRVGQAEGELAERQKLKKMAEDELAARRAEVQEQIDEAKGARERAAAVVPETPRALFNKLTLMFEDGQAMAAVDQEDPRQHEYTCGGCYMSITIENVNKLLTGDNVVRCNACQRILYLPAKVREGMGTKSR